MMARKLILKESQAPYILSLDETLLGQETVIIERDGEALAAIVPIEEYRRLKASSGQPQPEAEDEKMRTFYADMETFRRLLPELLQAYREQFVAIFRGQIVDADPDRWTLAKRVYAKCGYQPIYMGEVLEEPRVYEFSSPEISR